MVYEPDLMFASSIEGTAAKLGLAVRFVYNLEHLDAQLRLFAPSALIINLDAAQGKLGVVEPLIKKGIVKSVGYYSHVNAALAAEARRIGIESVLARGAFSARLSEILRELS